MPDVQEGLGQNTELDVNSDSGFMAALAEQAGRSIPEEQLQQAQEQDRSVAGGLVEAREESRPRDERGRFAPAASPAEEEGVAPETPEGEQETQADPELASFLERHGGDANAALQAALEEKRNRESLIGRQGSEVGQLREQIAELRGRLEAIPTQPAQQAPAAPPFVSTEQIEDLFSRDESGGRGAMSWIVENRPDLIEPAIRVWAVDDPVAAAGFNARWETAKMLDEHGRRAPAVEQEPQRDEFIEDLRMERQIGETIAQVRATMQDGEWDAIKEHIVPVLNDEKTSVLIKNAVVSNDPATQRQGVDAVVQIARGRAIAAATAAATQERTQQKKEQKQVAQVATGSLRPVQERQPEDGELSSEERVKRFHEILMGTETTSVRDGLTFGSRP